ncbi:7608_t:CDS:2 [Rhizophagus irregularis]|nr:7608_t:CDS:2 [Rhizophagus irregularis]
MTRLEPRDIAKHDAESRTRIEELEKYRADTTSENAKSGTLLTINTIIESAHSDYIPRALNHA